VFNGKVHPVYWDWEPGSALSAPVGYIDDTETIPGRPEVHRLTVPAPAATIGRHSLTVVVNADVAAGFRDDFVLKRLEVADTVGVRVGW